MADSRHGLTAGEVHVWRADVRAIDARPMKVLLEAAELSKARKLLHEEDSHRYIVARGMLRIALSTYLDCNPRDIAFGYGRYGKPRLEDERPGGLRFNASGSGHHVVVAVTSAREVGVDVEMVRPDFPCTDVARSFFSPQELSLLETLGDSEKLAAFFRIWTRKEALLKATGEGLSSLSRDLDVLTGGILLRRDVKWHVRDLDIASGYAAAVAVEGKIGSLKMIDL